MAISEIERKKKIFGIVKSGDQLQIAVTHVTIRESIFFLVLKLIILEVLSVGGIVGLHMLLFSTAITSAVGESIQAFNVQLLIIFVSVKTILTIYVIIQWLEEYYEITPKEVIHKRGLIFRKEEDYTLSHLERLALKQDIIGRIFNYGSLKMYDWVLGKDVQLYLIHNPLKYYHILQTLLPEADEQKEVFREHLLEKERI